MHGAIIGPNVIIGKIALLTAIQLLNMDQEFVAMCT